jgi:hypothetical protein
MGADAADAAVVVTAVVTKRMQRSGRDIVVFPNLT